MRERDSCFRLTPSVFVMTLNQPAQTLAQQHNLDRAQLLVGAKAIAQEIIDESQASDAPLQGLVYDVSGLYNEGEPRCTFDSPDSETFSFTGEFRAANDDIHKIERSSIALDRFKELCKPRA